MLKFTKDHEWLRLEGDIATVGITDYAQQQLGDVVFVELPEVGRTVAAHGEVAVVESVKAASDVYSPVSGEIVAVNEALSGDPSMVNSAAETGGWFFRIKLSDTGEVDGQMDQDAYLAYLAGL
jgi:glycine cleavage system H protein